jgi:hypothetical protein
VGRGRNVDYRDGHLEWLLYGLKWRLQSWTLRVVIVWIEMETAQMDT